MRRKHQDGNFSGRRPFRIVSLDDWTKHHGGGATTPNETAEANWHRGGRPRAVYVVCGLHSGQPNACSCIRELGRSAGFWYGGVFAPRAPISRREHCCTRLETAAPPSPVESRAPPPSPPSATSVLQPDHLESRSDAGSSTSSAMTVSNRNSYL